MTTMLSGPQLLSLKLGMILERPAGASVANGSTALFTVTGGRILVTAIVGTITTTIQAQATTMKLTANHATGTDVDLCATLDINGFVAGRLLGITGTYATAMVGSGHGSTVIPTQPIIVNVGTIDQVSGAASSGGISWSLRYFPFDNAATVALS